MQLSDYMVNPGDYALSRDLDVDFWLAQRRLNSKPELREVSDFVIINSCLHNEFDAFKKSEVKLQFSFVEVNELLSVFCPTQTSIKY